MKHTITKALALATGTLLPLAAGAQSGVVAAGGAAASATHSLSYSVGQVATGSTATAYYRLNEGVQQPLTVEEVGLDPAADPWLTVYPNPTAMSLTLRREGGDEATRVRLYSIDGRMLLDAPWDGPTLTLDLSAYAAGVYMLQVNDRNYKISKQ